MSLKKNVEDYNSKPAQASVPLSNILEYALDANSNSLSGSISSTPGEKNTFYT